MREQFKLFYITTTTKNCYDLPQSKLYTLRICLCFNLYETQMKLNFQNSCRICI